MNTSSIRWVIARRRQALIAAFGAVLAAGGGGLSQAADDAQRDLSVEQTAIFAVQAPALGAPPGALSVEAWVDHPDGTYAVGEAVRLFVRTNKDAYVMVLNVGPSGTATMLFPNMAQHDSRVGANQVVEVAGPGSGTSIRVSGPVGRELIKVIASTSPTPLFEAAKLMQPWPSTSVTGRSASVARDMQVTMDSQPPGHEWDDYNKIITTIAGRQVRGTPMPPARDFAVVASLPGRLAPHATVESLVTQ